MRELHEWDKNIEERNEGLFEYEGDLTSIERLMMRDYYYEVSIGRYGYFFPSECHALILYTIFSIVVSIVWYNYT